MPPAATPPVASTTALASSSAFEVTGSSGSVSSATDQPVPRAETFRTRARRVSSSRLASSRTRACSKRAPAGPPIGDVADRKSTRLNSSHGYISYAVFCLQKNNQHEFGRVDEGQLAVYGETAQRRR